LFTTYSPNAVSTDFNADPASPSELSGPFTQKTAIADENQSVVPAEDEYADMPALLSLTNSDSSTLSSPSSDGSDVIRRSNRKRKLADTNASQS
jgi:hypothetical protein